MNQPLPSYASIPGDVIVPAPYFELGSKFYSFLLESSVEKLQELCDSWFNNVTSDDIRFEPLLPWVLISFSDYRSSKSSIDSA